MYLFSNSKNFTPGVKILEFKSNRRHQDFAKVKFTRITGIKTFLKGVIFGGYKFGGVKFFGLRKC